MDADPQAIHRIEAKLDEIVKYLKITADFIPDKPSDKNRTCPVCNDVISFAPSMQIDAKGNLIPTGLRRHCLCKITPQRY